MSKRADQFATWFSRKLFTWQSLVAHVIAFSIAWRIEGGDHHLFLDAISIEAVLVTLLVGMATRRAEQQRALLEQLDRERLQLDLDMDRATNHLLRQQSVQVDHIEAISRDLHQLTSEMHRHVTVERSDR
jgi:hypothetical protein